MAQKLRKDFKNDKDYISYLEIQVKVKNGTLRSTEIIIGDLQKQVASLEKQVNSLQNEILKDAREYNKLIDHATELEETANKYYELKSKINKYIIENGSYPNIDDCK